MSAALRTTCPYCGVGCGLSVQRGPEGVLIAGDRAHPANHGRLCSKGSALADTLVHDGRLLRPRVDGVESSWDTALDRVAEGFARIIATHGPQAVAFYVSGQLLTEDYYVANKLMKGFIGSANIDTNSRLCMSSAVAAHQRAFGEDIVPVDYEDLDHAELIVLVGSNTAWCHPVLYQRIVAAKERQPALRIVVIDPRRTASCAIADLHLPIRAGTDAWLFNGLLGWLHRHAVVDAGFVQAHTAELEPALHAAEGASVESVAQACGVSVGEVTTFYRWFAQTGRVITAFSQGVNQSSSGTDKANSIINCHLLTGRIGTVGAGPFSITGQPNAMGGREAGGLANTLAAHLRLEDAGHRRLVQDFWRSPRIASRPGLKAVELFEAIETGQVRAVWIMATNPVVSLPDADRVRRALAGCELVVVSDCEAETDTTRLAHVLLPAAAWGEKDGTVTNSERRISRQRAFVAAPGEARPDWWIVCEAARRMGFGSGFGFGSAQEIFVEHARLSALDNAGTRAFDIGALAELDGAAYAALEPLQWPAPAGAGVTATRPFADGRFYHADGRARFVAVHPQAPVNAPDAEYPLVLNTGRIRDQWHTMSRSGKSARLAAHLPEPFVDMHAADALAAGLRERELVRVQTRWGSLVARLRTSGELARGTLFVPIHWSGQFASDARVGALVNPVVDPHSGEPEFKHTPARVESFAVDWYGFAIARAPLALGELTWWSRAAGEQCSRYELAGRGIPADWSAWARAQFGAPAPDADWIEYHDAAAGIHRAALLANGRLEACVFVSSRPELPSQRWLAGLFSAPALNEAERSGLLAGRAAAQPADCGPIVCACYGVGRERICSEIRVHGLRSAQQIGVRLRAGTNCGSCLPELTALLKEARNGPAAG